MWINQSQPIRCKTIDRLECIYRVFANSNVQSIIICYIPDSTSIFYSLQFMLQLVYRCCNYKWHGRFHKSQGNSPFDVQGNGRRAVCVTRWPLTCSARVNILPQSANGHRHFFCPLCIRRCRQSLLDVENAQLQPSNVHRYGLSPVWDLMCCLSRQSLSNFRPQPSKAQTNSESCRCTRACELTHVCEKNAFVQPGWRQLQHKEDTDWMSMSWKRKKTQSKQKKHITTSLQIKSHPSR